MSVAVDVNRAPKGRARPADAAAPSDRAPWWARPTWPVLVVVALATLITIRASFSYNGSRTFMLFDDAMISMRYARNLADGHGLVFNAGKPPVEGYTNFLWTLWMAALHLVLPTRFVAAAVSASGAALVAVTVVLVGRIARLLAPATDRRDLAPMVGALAMWGVALWYPLLWWSVRGLEPGLLAAALAGGVLLALRIDADGATGRRLGALAVVLGIGILTRTDFAIVAVVIVGWLAWRRGATRRAAAVVGISAALVLAAHTAFRLAYYGQVVPNTYVLKIEGIPLADRLDRGFRALGAVLVAELAVLFCFAIIAVVQRRRARSTYLLCTLVLATLAYSVSVGGDAWEWTQSSNRYIAPIGPLLFLLAALGLSDIAAMSQRARAKALVGIGIVLTVCVVIANRIEPAGDGIRTQSNLDEFRSAHWLALACGIAFIVLALVVGARPSVDRRLVFGALAAALLVVVALPAWMDWRRTDGALVEVSKDEAGLGLGIRDAVLPGRHPSIAVVAAGNIPYWSMLPTVDVLGKVDPVIAHRKPQPIPFNPGHDKWDYRYSICKLRPDVVVQLWEPSVKTVQMIERCGYTNIVALDRAGHVVTYYLVRNGSHGFDPQKLKEAVFGRGAMVLR